MMFNEDYDPYEELENLKQFAAAADMHIMQLITNQDNMVKQINALQKDLLQLIRVNKELAKEIRNDQEKP